MSGSGQLEWTDGRVYKGKFKDGMRHGHGIMVWPGMEITSDLIRAIDGKTYEGEWKRDKMHGKV